MKAIIVQILLRILLEGNGLYSVFRAIIISAGFWFLFQKCGQKPWKALIPCYRYYALAECAGCDRDGSTLMVTDFIFSLSSALSDAVGAGSSWHNPLQLLASVFAIIFVIYEIRVYLRLIEVFDRKKIWVLLWIPLEAGVSILWGLCRKYQPLFKVQDFQDDMSNYFTGANAKVLDEGLTVNLKERTVRQGIFRKKYLLRDIHIYVKPGRMVLLLGGSGAGKTTFLNAVNGYEKAKAEVMLNGHNMYKEYDSMKYDVGLVPQQDLMRGNDTVFRTLMDASSLRLPISFDAPARRDRVEFVMDLFGLTPVRESLLEKLSGGQRKRVSIAMEFISNPTLFILDEPDSGLDGVMARELMRSLRQIADQGKIVMVITHTPDRVIDMFDDVIVLAKDKNRTGRLAFYGTVPEAREFFGKESMEQILKAINREEEGGEGRADEFIERYAEAHNG